MTFPDDRLDLRVELGLDGGWTDVSDRRHSQTITINRGRADETSQAQPTSVDFQLDNPDGALTPNNAMSPFWPNVKRGAPCRLSVRGPDVALALSGGDDDASTPDLATLDITGDIDLRIEANLLTWMPSDRPALISKWDGSSDQRSWIVWFFKGELAFSWSEDGTIGGAFTRTATEPLPARGPLAVRVRLRVDNGGGGFTVIFDTAETKAGPWTQLGNQITEFSGTTSIFASTADVKVGNRIASTTDLSDPLVGRVDAAEIWDGIEGLGGTVVADPDFTAQDPDTTSFDDTFGNTWTANGGAEITDFRTRFVGNIDAIQPSWPFGDNQPTGPVPSEARVDITASGMLRRMSQGAKPLASTLFRHVTGSGFTPFVDAYWPLEDGRESGQFSSPIPGVSPAEARGQIQLASIDSLLASGPLPTLSGGQRGGWAGTVPPHDNGGNWRVDVFVNIPTPDVTERRVLQVLTTGRVVQWQVSMSDTVVRIIGWDSDGNEVVNHTGGVPESFHGEDVWTLWSLHAEQNGGIVDWDLIVVPIDLGVAFAFTTTGFSGQVGRVTGVQDVITGAAPPDGISHGHAIASHDLGLGWLAGADTAWIGESASHRFWRLCTEESIPAAIIGDPIDPAFLRGQLQYSEAMGPQRQQTLLELLQGCADVDLGIFYERRDKFGLVFRTRKTLENQPAALALDAAANEIAPPFEPAFDDQRLRNDVTATSTDGPSARQVDQQSIDADGLYDVDIDLPFVGGLNVQEAIVAFQDGLGPAISQQLEQQAAWRLHLGTWPDMRYPTVTSELAIAEQLIDNWLDLDLGDRITVDNLPVQHPTDTVDLLVEGYVEQLTPTRWIPALTCSPGGPWTVGVLDDDPANPNTDLPRLDAESSVINSDINDVEMNIATTDTFGAVWTTTSANYPLLIEIGGEVIEAGSALDFGGIHVFLNCVRSVNGVVKSHPAGTPVHVAEPFRLSL